MNVAVYIPSHLNLYTLKIKASKRDFHSNAIEEPLWDPQRACFFSLCEEHFNNLKTLFHY